MKAAVVVTTIQAPNAVMQALAVSASAAGADFFVLGDRKSPADYNLHGATYLSLTDQHNRFGTFSKQLPVDHYVRKNLGYLAALEAGADWIVETDDDNYPLANFLQIPGAPLRARRLISSYRWINAYRHFGPTQPVWPRGLPLEALSEDQAAVTSHSPRDETPVIVQGLADDNPDVDAVYRLTRTLPVNFDHGAPPASLERGLWCPFNSQNTWFRRDVAPLLYLPAHCSFRMTDIWRSFIAQRCLWEIGHRLIFVAPTVRQDRNQHNLLRDFGDEVPGYLHNDRIASILQDTTLTGTINADLTLCYEALVREAVFPAVELGLVARWLEEVASRS